MRMLAKTTTESWVRFWVRFLSLFVHICPFTQTTKASEIGSLRIENIEISLVRQEGLEPPTLYIGFKGIFYVFKIIPFKQSVEIVPTEG